MDYKTRALTIAPTGIYFLFVGAVDRLVDFVTFDDTDVQVLFSILST